MRSDVYVIGIDGGATKSRMVLARGDGTVILSRIGKALNYHAIGMDRAATHLRQLLKPVPRKYTPYVAVLGLAGLNTSRDERVYRRIARSVFSARTRVVIYNDTKVALEDACKKPPRMLVVSGTGSNVYGEYRRTTKSGGWDFLLADEGSAYYLGREALRAVVRSFDGRGPHTALTNLILKKLHSKTVPHMISHIYDVWARNPQDYKSYIASFAPLVDAAARRKDGVAKRIIHTAGEELALAAHAVIRALKVEHVELCVGYTGSNFNAPGLKNLVSQRVREVCPRAYFVSQVDPARGAVKLALKILER